MAHETDEAGPMTPTTHAPRPSRGAAGAPPRVPVGQRRLRAALLLTALLWLPVSITLVALGRLMWVSIPLAVLTVAAVLFWLRTEARADRARQQDTHAHAAAARPSRRRRPVHAPAPAAQAPVAEVPELTSDDTQVIRDPARYAEAVDVASASEVGHPAEPAVVEPRYADPRDVPAAATGGLAAQASPAAYPEVLEAHDAKDDVFDLEAETAAELAALPPAGQPADGTWNPVPVPAPTYTMKAKAEPRLTESGIPADVFETPEFADEVAELDERALFARRAASQ